jgi:16S rRNA C967 or C1407 C5-methylase (RsmB/RsmF family)
MLAAALEAVRIGGHILYSTCSISPLENEQVIGKLYKKREERFEEVSVFEPLSEQLEHGFIIMPDTAAGRGPLYFCLLRRIS